MPAFMHAMMSDECYACMYVMMSVRHACLYAMMCGMHAKDVAIEIHVTNLSCRGQARLVVVVFTQISLHRLASLFHR